MPDPAGVPAAAVIRMFAGIAARYDLANGVLSLGLHRQWRRALVRLSGLSPGDCVLDCATGTGDLALALARRVGHGGYVLGTDPCAPMLELARRKAARFDLPVLFQLADLLRLPYAPGAFDAATAAFGIRSVADPLRALNEMARVVRRGGRVLVLEFGLPQRRAWRSLYGFYSRYIIPPLGGLITGERSAYEYLHSTSATFPCGKAFLQLMRQTRAFSEAQGFALTGGVVYLYRGLVRG
jgi:demethylmenaquinone methyltransferase/2-methoxy-6-polyprenyl-1,4-benzoquinol methylase